MLTHVLKSKAGSYVDTNLPLSSKLVAETVYPLSLKVASMPFVPLVFIHEYVDPEGYIWACVGIVMPSGEIVWTFCANVGSERVLVFDYGIRDGKLYLKDEKNIYNFEVDLKKLGLNEGGEQRGKFIYE